MRLLVLSISLALSVTPALAKSDGVSVVVRLAAPDALGLKDGATLQLACRVPYQVMRHMYAADIGKISRALGLVPPIELSRQP